MRNAIVILAALAAAMTLLAPTAAFAHARLDRSEPASGVTITTSPERIDLWFSQELRRTTELPTLIVVNASGDVVSNDAVLDDEDRLHLSATLPPALPRGQYTVIYHILSDADDHEGWGAYTYTVGDAGGGMPTATPPTTPVMPTATPPAAPTPTPAPTATPTPPSGEGGSGGSIAIGIVIGLAIGVAVTGGVATLRCRT